MSRSEGLTFDFFDSSVFVANAAFDFFLTSPIYCQFVLEERPVNNYSTFLILGARGMGLTVRTDIFINRENNWNNTLNIQEKEGNNADFVLNFVKTKRKASGEKRKAEEAKKEEGIDNGNYLFKNRSIGLNMSSKQNKDNSSERRTLDRCVDKKPRVDFNTIRYSNHMKDNVQSNCQICKIPQDFCKMRSHTKSKHNIAITDYKKKYGEIIDNIVETVYHKCGICKRAILLDGDILATHARLHRISHKAYSDKYITLRKQEDKQCLKKLIDPINQTPKEAEHTYEVDETSPSPEVIDCSVDIYKVLSGQALADKLLADLDALLKRYS